MNDTLTSANEEAAYWQNITALNVAEYLVYQQSATQDNKTYTTALSTTLYYAGYIVVQATATSNTTYAETLYSSYGVNFDQNVTLGTSGTAVFPVLPGTVEVRIGNLEETSTNSVTATIIYYY
jgi:ABC-type uncharacterized transport system involved in gliding motility auxiliary subunit